MIKILVYVRCTLLYTPPDVTSIDKGYQSKAGEPAHPTYYYILPCFQKLRRKSCISVSQVLRPIKWVPFSTPKLLQLLLMIIAFLFQFMPLRKALVITDTSFSRLLKRPLQPLTLVAVVPLSVRSSKESVVGRRSMQTDINNYCIDLLQPQKAKATGKFVLQIFIFATCKFIWYFIIGVDTILQRKFDISFVISLNGTTLHIPEIDLDSITCKIG